MRLLADDIWQLSTGGQVLLAVAIEPNPEGAYDGFAEFLATPEGRVLPARAGRAAGAVGRCERAQRCNQPG